MSAYAGQAGAALWRAWSVHERLPVFPGGAPPPDVDSGYAIQDALASAAGLAVAGWKVGATNLAAQRRLNLPGPLYGRLFEPFVRQSPARFGAEFALRALEPELAVRLADDLPGRERPWTVQEVAAVVDTVMPALEVPDTRLEHWDTLGAPAFIADNAAAGRLVLGAAVAGWGTVDLAAMRVRLEVNGRTVETGSGAAVLGHPLAAVAWLAGALPRRGHRLRAGDLVITGTCTPIGFAAPGDEARAVLEGLGEASAQFA